MCAGSAKFMCRKDDERGGWLCSWDNSLRVWGTGREGGRKSDPGCGGGEKTSAGRGKRSERM